MDADQPMEQVVAPPQEETIYQLPGVVLWMGSQQVGAGILTVTTNCVRFAVPEQNWQTEWSYQQILLHAVSKEHDTPNIYCQITTVGPELLTRVSQQQDEDEAGTDELIHEIRFVPPQQESTQLADIYNAMSRGAAMNPDPPGPEDDDDDGDFYFDENEVYGENGGNNEDDEDGEDEVGQDVEMSEN